jgi:NDP-sugar pyrophosphorylase family protein
MIEDPGELSGNPHPFSPAYFFDLSQTAHGEIFRDVEWVWEIIPKIKDYITEHVKPGHEGAEVAETAFIGEEVQIGEGTVVEPNAVIKGPAIIGRNCSIRAGSYIRDNALVGDGSTIGNSSEVKNALIFNQAEIPHFNYVGDSVIGYRGHLGAGAILSNVRLDRQNIAVRTSKGKMPTNLRKFGAIIGDRTEVGCNAVLSPGSVVGKDCIIYPGAQFKGHLPSNRIFKLRQEHEIVERE